MFISPLCILYPYGAEIIFIFSFLGLYSSSVVLEDKQTSQVLTVKSVFLQNTVHGYIQFWSQLNFIIPDVSYKMY